MALVVVAAARLSWAVASWILADCHVAFAWSSWARSDAVAALARTWPFLTWSPTFTLSVSTRQVVPELAEDELDAPSCGAEPKISPYVVDAATVPVEVTSWLMVPRVTVEVR